MQRMQNAKISQKMQLHFLCKEVPQKCRIMQMHESGHSRGAQEIIIAIGDEIVKNRVFCHDI